MRRVRFLLSLALVGAPLSSDFAVDSLQASPARPVDATAVQPERLQDTRSGLGAPKAAMVVQGQTLAVAVPAASNVGATSVVLNLTATDATGEGWVKAWPCGEPMPATSSLNFTANESVANAVILKLRPAGVCLTTSAPANLIADVTGWYTGTQDFNGSTPNRVLDTRITGNPLEPGVERRLKVASTPGIDGSATMAALNLTVDRPAAAGWVVAYPCGEPTNSSTVNFEAGEIVANLTIVGLTAGDVCFRSLGKVDFVVDSYGWSSSGGRLRVITPSRLLDTRDTAQWPTGKLASASTIELHVADRGGVPANADAALITVTVANASSRGFVTVWPCDRPFPVASTLNTWPHSLRSNFAFVKLSATQGTACLQYRSAQSTPTDLIVDVVGYTTGGPARVVAPGIGTVTPAPTPPPTTPPTPTPTTPTTPTPTTPAPPTPTTPPTGIVLYSNAFNSASDMSRLKFQIHDEVGQDLGESWNEIHHFNGDHNMACAGPPALRPITEDLTVATHVWYCAPNGDPALGHFMTGMDTGNYVSIAFAPTAANGVITFPATANKVCWDINTTNLGNRKWTQLVVVSRTRFDANGGNLTYVNPDFEANAPSQIKLTGGDFMFVDVQSTTQYFTGHSKTLTRYDNQLNATDKAARFQTCVRDNGNGTVTRTQQRQGGLYSITGPGSFPAGPRVFILQDESYNPTKAVLESPARVSDPFTWHWDNITVLQD